MDGQIEDLINAFLFFDVVTAARSRQAYDFNKVNRGCTMVDSVLIRLRYNHKNVVRSSALTDKIADLLSRL